MSETAEQAPTINMIDVLRGIKRHKFLVVFCLLLGIGGGFLVLSIFKPAYLAESQIIIENLATSYEKPGLEQQLANNAVDDRLVLSQMSVLKSTDLAARVVDQLGLHKNSEFNPLLKATSWSKKILIVTGFADDPAESTPQQNAVKNLISKVTVYQVPESNVLAVKVIGGENQVVADIANTLAEFYVASTRETQAGSTDRARNWLSQQIADLRQKVSLSDNAVEKYRSEAGLLKGQTSTLGNQQISELNSQITIAETAAAEATARANEIKAVLTARGTVDASSDVLGSPIVQSLRAQQVAATQKISELSAVYLPSHPKMIAAQKQLGNINSQIRQEALKIVESLAGQAKIANARADSLRATLEKMKGRESVDNISDVKLKELERDALANRTLLESMLARYADASARQDSSLQPGLARVIQKATVPPLPYFPKTGPIMLLTSLAGLALGLGLSFLMEVMSAAKNSGIAPAAQPTQLPHKGENDPQLESEPYAPSRPPIKAPIRRSALDSLIINQPASASRAGALALINEASADGESEQAKIAEQLAALCITDRQSQGAKVVSFTSIQSTGPDAALAAITTARALANQKKRVVVVDVGPTPGTLEFLFGLANGPGLTDLLEGKADFTKVICRDPQSTAHAIRLGLSIDPNSAKLLAQKLPSVITALVSIYDFVLLHAGEASAATPALIKNCQIAYLLAPPERRTEALEAERILAGQGVAASRLISVGSDNQFDYKLAASA